MLGLLGRCLLGCYNCRYDYTSKRNTNPLTQSSLTFQDGFNSFFDLALAILPVTMIWNLQIKTKKKVALCIVLGLGVL